MLVDCTRKIGISLIVRIHPNSGQSDSIQNEQLKLFQSHPHVKLFPAASNVSSYDIMKRSCGIITYGSTIGLEAAWNEIPCAVLADCKYDELGVADKILTKKDMLDWLEKSTKLASPPHVKSQKMGAASWALFVEVGGEHLRNCEIVPGPWGAYQVRHYKNVRLAHSKFVTLIGLVNLKFKMLLFLLKSRLNCSNF